MMGISEPDPTRQNFIRNTLRCHDQFEDSARMVFQDVWVFFEKLVAAILQDITLPTLLCKQIMEYLHAKYKIRSLL